MDHSERRNRELRRRGQERPAEKEDEDAELAACSRRSSGVIVPLSLRRVVLVGYLAEEEGEKKKSGRGKTAVKNAERERSSPPSLLQRKLPHVTRLGLGSCRGKCPPTRTWKKECSARPKAYFATWRQWRLHALTPPVQDSKAVGEKMEFFG